ncbi:GTP cyclohydrolase I [Cryobacterium psychrophilum]|uniref:GTP cyclohydrolase 1 n=1 Tax=Cryobacterium psychrophilum TaxID=41988 RepID=A0A4Y8KR97_9MICO|nr:GTP cyclohydrolase I [Cryobacterium psychrophilum]TDW29920.1 GTP cyclohydrolase I [Cryobacterium psychrophilum]TFD76485.1 GTP cyclohydrolase I [Cryobacterium psychrophilum]
MGVDKARIQAAVAEILVAIGEDPDREGLESTPTRVADAYAEFFGGIGRDPLDHLRDFLPVGPHTGELVLLRDVSFRSICEHHLLPFLGTAHIAYLPRERVVGLGRLPAVIETIAARPQLQERLTEEIAEVLQDGLDPLGVLVVLDAVHGCVGTRGPRQTRSSTVTLASRGSLSSPVARAEIISLIASGS